MNMDKEDEIKEMEIKDETQKLKELLKEKLDLRLKGLEEASAK